jgi:hypothetical protein
MTVLGIDLGNAGAIALLDESGDLLEVCDMPCRSDGPKGRPMLNAPLLAAIVGRAGAAKAYVEHVGPRPTDGTVQAFAFGRCKGVVEGVLATSDVPLVFLTAPQWKRLIGIPPGKGMKDATRSEAIRRWPAKAALFARGRDDGRAEAALIGVAGLKRGRRAGLEPGEPWGIQAP